MEIRGKTISYASFKNKNREAREKNLIKTIADIENKKQSDSDEELDILKNELIIAPLWKSGAILDSPCPSVVP